MAEIKEKDMEEMFYEFIKRTVPEPETVMPIEELRKHDMFTVPIAFAKEYAAQQVKEAGLNL